VYEREREDKEEEGGIRVSHKHFCLTPANLAHTPLRSPMAEMFWYSCMSTPWSGLTNMSATSVMSWPEGGPSGASMSSRWLAYGGGKGHGRGRQGGVKGGKRRAYEP
jgi:hypothetical protein